MTIVEFEVHGVPVPQGSLVRTRYGVRPDNPNTKPWRAAVAAAAADAMGVADHDGCDFVRVPDQPLHGPLELEAIFYFPRPKSHYRTGKLAGQLKPSAPLVCATKPDVDKLLRAVGDAITGIVCRDDSQIVRVSARKLYGLPRARVIVREVEELAA